jgi:hypothetical protein
MTPEQCRAARGWLGCSQVELARQANASLRAVAAFERGEQKPRPNNLIAMRRALLFDRDGTAAGILRQGTNPDLSGRCRLTPTVLLDHRSEMLRGETILGFRLTVPSYSTEKAPISAG